MSSRSLQLSRRSPMRGSGRKRYRRLTRCRRKSSSMKWSSTLLLVPLLLAQIGSARSHCSTAALLMDWCRVPPPSIWQSAHALPPSRRMRRLRCCGRCRGWMCVYRWSHTTVPSEPWRRQGSGGRHAHSFARCGATNADRRSSRTISCSMLAPRHQQVRALWSCLTRCAGYVYKRTSSHTRPPFRPSRARATCLVCLGSSVPWRPRISSQTLSRGAQPSLRANAQDSGHRRLPCSSGCVQRMLLRPRVCGTLPFLLRALVRSSRRRSSCCKPCSTRNSLHNSAPLTRASRRASAWLMATLRCACSLRSAWPACAQTPSLSPLPLAR
mmetsp:Transcript_51737/g.118869  ORF Transcript_51737/g.118869 Transcript_51737/m.118869 type:complete len:326 (+) Transcript_51737:822-1799(+)